MELNTWVYRYNAHGGANRFEIELLNLVNEIREREGLNPLKMDNRLMMSARFQAQSMVEFNNLTGLHPFYGNITTIVQELFGFEYRRLAPSFSLWNPTAQAVIDDWMSITVMREAILDPEFEYTGIGAMNTSTSTGSFENIWVKIFSAPEAGTHPDNIPMSSITLPHRRLTLAERDQWVQEYNALGGPNAFELEVIRLTNVERANAGLPPLSANQSVMMSARFISQSMANLGYYSHIHPIYGHFTNAPRELFGVNVAAENIAIWQLTPQEVVNSWMGSEGHRNNILSPYSTEIGVGFFRGRWTQMFR